MSPPLVSIIIPYYNKGNTLGRSISSILSQTFKQWELIIIDDCSNDSIPRDLIPNDIRIRVYRNPVNLGAAKTRQKGLECSKGEYVAFLDADDWWDKRFLELCLNQLRICTYSDGVYVKSKVFFGDGSTALRQYSTLGLTRIRETLIQYARPWQTGGILWQKSSCGSWGELKSNEDSWFEICSAKYNKLLFVDEICYFIDRTGENHLSSEFSKCKVSKDNYEVFLKIRLNYFNHLSVNYKIILSNRLIRCQLKIHEYCNIDSVKEFSTKLKNASPFLGLFGRFRLILKLMHYFLQKTPYRINF